MSRYITLEQYNNCSEEFKKEYQKWWSENTETEDKVIPNQYLTKKDVAAIPAVKDIKSTGVIINDNSYYYYDEITGIPCIETLIDFIMDTGNGEIVLGDEVYYYIKTVKGNSVISKKIPIYPKKLKESLLRVAQAICKGVE